jgi:UDP-N-acetylmuramyl tripeptide synthase
MKVIGVTGTKGKTTVAYLMRSVLKAAGLKVGMVGTVEIDDGEKVVPAEMTTPGAVELVEMFCRMRANGVTHCVMEVSSHALDQRRVAGIDFAVGIFTNLTGDHLDYHGTMEEYAAAKARLFEGLKENAVAIVNADDAWASIVLHNTRAHVVSYTLTSSLSKNQGINLQWLGWIEDMTSESMKLIVGGSESVKGFSSPLVGKHNAYNLMSVIVAARTLGLEQEMIYQVLGHARGAPGRLQRVQGAADFSVFVDYAHTHDALENVLSALRATMAKAPGTDISRETHGDFGGRPMPRARRGGWQGRLICVFGCGGDRDCTKRPKMGAVAEKLADIVFVTSDNPRTEDAGRILEEICGGFSQGWQEWGRIQVEPDRRAAIKAAITMAGKGDVILIAGKGHENYQIIGTTKYHFDDVEEAQAALAEKLAADARG